MLLAMSIAGHGQQLPRANKPTASEATSNHAVAVANYGNLPLGFEANQGQTDPQVRFLSRGNGYSLFLTDTAATLALTKRDASAAERGQAIGIEKKLASSAKSGKTDVVRMELVGTSHGLRVAGDDKLPGTANYFIGNDPAKWRQNVPTYGKVRYSGVYPGVDLVYYGNQRQLEYDFVVAPNAEAKSIKLHFAGADKLELDSNGDLKVIAKNGQVSFRKPVAYQEESGRRQPVEGRFTLLARNTVSFTLGSYDRSQSVVIDPTLAYSTYLGGSTGSGATAIAADASGNTYVTGETADTDFPITSGAHQSTNNAGRGIPNVFVTKLNPTGTALVFSTYLGGSGNGSSGDVGLGIAIDSSDNSYITGYTFSSDFPLKNAFQSTNKAAQNGLSEPFVAKINASGSGLVYSTYLGGSSNIYSKDRGDRGYGIAVNGAGNAYVAGSTQSTDFPVTSGAYQGTDAGAANGSGNAFITEMGVAGSSLVYSTYLGGSGIVYDVTNALIYTRGDGARGIAVDKSGNVYVSGIASSTDFPVTGGAFQSVNNAAANTASNAFISKLNPTGSSLIYSTYLGGSSTSSPDLTCFGCDDGDGAASIAIDSSGNAYVVGGTYSSNFPTTNGVFQKTNQGKVNAFVSKINPTGTALIYSTLLGGSGSQGDVAYGMALDPAGDVYVSGFASSANFPITSGAFQSTNEAASKGATNAFLSEVNPTGTGLLYSTYFGGMGYPTGSDGSGPYVGDYSYGLTLDCSGNAYLAGTASSPNFPTTSTAYQTVGKAETNAFVSKFSFASGSTCSSKVSTTTSVTSNDNPVDYGAEVTFTAFVQASSGTGIPTDSVMFSVDGGIGTSVILDGTGHATYTDGSLAAGSHTITASYSGDSNYLASNGTFIETIIGPAASIAVVSGSGQGAVVGTAFAAPLMVVVKDVNGNPVSGASVSFKGNGLSFASTTVTTGSGGTASTTAIPTAVGTLTATASTSGVSASATFALTGAASTPPAGLGIISTYAGDGTKGYSGDGGAAISAELAYPVGTAMDKAGNLYVADLTNNRIRKVTPQGVVSTYAGNGTAGFSGDGGPATSAEINGPLGVGLDSAGNLYIGDSYNQRVRKVTPQGIISTFAGNGAYGYNGDGIAATSAKLYYPSGIASDSNGNIFIGDYFNNRVRKVNIAGIISTVAGTGSTGYSGDGGAATEAELYYPTGVAFDPAGNLYIADYYNNRVRKVTTGGIISTFAGTGVGGYNGDGIAATSADLYAANAVSTDNSGNVYIGDYANNRVRKVDTTGIISTVAGDGKAGYSGDGGLATSAEFTNPQGLSVDTYGSLYIADSNNNRIRKVQYQTSTPVFSPVAGTYSSAQSVTITDSTPGATIYYTTNGTTPTTLSTKYTGAITVSSSETIEAIALASEYGNSAVASAAYTIIPLPVALRFIPVTPCRIADTRSTTGAFGGPKLAAAATRTFDVPQSACGIPTTAVAYSLNATVVPIASLGYLTIWPGGEAQPTVSTLNSTDGRVKANATITPAGTNGGVSVYASDATQFILDIDGYFVPAGTNASGLEFFPLAPCRIADTRNPTGTLGGPSLASNTARAFPVQSSACGIPSSAQAYSLNVTAVPHDSLGFLSLWPSGEAQPVVSTLNATTGAVTANAAIVPAGTGGEVSILVSDASDVILDVNGYFAPPAAGGLSLYTVTPCRVIDTRNGAGAFDGLLAVPVHGSSCAPPATAQAYVLNATVVPTKSLSYLTLWATGGAQPDVSTLNATDGAVTSNMAIVPTTNGSVDAFSTDSTNLLLDLSSYFAP